MDTNCYLTNSTEETRTYACGHWIPPTGYLSHSADGLTTKNIADLCPSCKMSLLAQRLSYFQRSNKRIGHLESQRLLLHVIEAKIYVSSRNWLNMVDVWSTGAARRLDGGKNVSLEIETALTILDNAKDGPLIMEFIQVARQINRLRQAQEEQRAVFQLEWTHLGDVQEYQLTRMNETLNPILACKQLAEAINEDNTLANEQNIKENQSSPNETLTSLLKTRLWNPQVLALGSRLQESLKQGNLKAILDEEMTNAEEIMATLLAVQRSIAIGDLKTKTRAISQK